MRSLLAADPLGQLLVDLEDRGTPSLKWALRWWQIDGTDTLHAAWAGTEEYVGMLGMALFLWGIESSNCYRWGETRIELWTPQGATMIWVWAPNSSVWDRAKQVTECIRKELPSPPTLKELLGRWAATRNGSSAR